MALVRVTLAALLLAGGLVLIAPAGPAAACSCAIGGPEERLLAASTVFSGVLVQRSRDKRWIEYAFEVDEVFKGSTTRTTRVWTGSSGSACGLPGLDVGKDYLVFGFVPRKGDRLFVGLCGGTTSGPGAVDRIEALTGPGQAPDLDGPRIDHGEPEDPPVPYWAMAVVAAGVVGALVVLLARRRRA